MGAVIEAAVFGGEIGGTGGYTRTLDLVPLEDIDGGTGATR